MRIKLSTMATLLTLAVILAPVISWSQVTGQCADCHTMHNSQDGVAVAEVWGTNASAGTTNTPNPKLLIRSGCLGCHTGINDPAAADALDACPKVLTYNAVYADTLAGGNFYWVQSSDAAGHNVLGVTGADTTLTAPPGHVETVEIDPKVAAIYKEYFDVKGKAVPVHVTDGRRFINQTNKNDIQYNTT